MADTFDSLIDRARNESSGNFLSSTDIQLRGMKLMAGSIDKFNNASGKLSWLMIGIAGLQVIILLGQIFKWW